MKMKKEITDMIYAIKNEIPDFDEEELLGYIKWALRNLYNSLSQNKEINVKCSEEVVNKILNNKEKFKLNSDIDTISIQFAQINDYAKIEDKINIKIYTSIYFYDNTINNNKRLGTDERYWNDSWMITIREAAEDLGKCKRCGAEMNYNKLDDSYECEYCRNKVYNKENFDWEIIDIEVKNSYK